MRVLFRKLSLSKTSEKDLAVLSKRTSTQVVIIVTQIFVPALNKQFILLSILRH